MSSFHDSAAIDSSAGIGMLDLLGQSTRLEWKRIEGREASEAIADEGSFGVGDRCALVARRSGNPWL